jgi:hypothetical protein
MQTKAIKYAGKTHSFPGPHVREARAEEELKKGGGKVRDRERWQICKKLPRSLKTHPAYYLLAE